MLVFYESVDGLPTVRRLYAPVLTPIEDTYGWTPPFEMAISERRALPFGITISKRRGAAIETVISKPHVIAGGGGIKACLWLVWVSLFATQRRRLRIALR